MNISKSASTENPTPEDGLSPGVSVVIPTYNSEQSLPQLVSELEKELPACAEAYEVILINDGSRDGSWDVILELAAKYVWVRGINLMRNYGQHNAVLCGIRTARFATCVTIDDDLQHPPSEICKLVEKLSEGYDLVYGTSQQLQQSWWRNFLSNYIKTALAVLLGQPQFRSMSAFRALRTEIRRAFERFSSPDTSVDLLLFWGTNKFTNVDVRYEARKVGKSNYSMGHLVSHTLVVLTASSVAPLRLAAWVGFAFTGLGALVLGYVVIRYLLEGSIAGFPFIASIISIFSGAQLFTIGIFGEYLARIYNRSMDRPGYIVRDVVATDRPTTSDHVTQVSASSNNVSEPAP